MFIHVWIEKLRTLSDTMFGKLRALNDFLPPSKIETEFIEHNRRIWENDGGSDELENGEFLFELNDARSAIIAYSYLANVLVKKHQLNLVAFTLGKSSVKKVLSGILRSTNRRVFSSFGTNSFLQVELNNKQQIDSNALFEKVYTSLTTKQDVENITVDGVWIGDLIYDSYLRENGMATINIKDDDFIRSLRRSLDIYIFWIDYFDTHIVKAINVSHCIYNLAILLRIAVSKDIPAFQINATHVYRLSKTNLFAYHDAVGMREAFRSLPVDIQAAGLEEAKQRIHLRFSGKVGVDMAYSKKSAYGGFKTERLLKESSKVKILIASHCFSDGPHCYGKNLFPDFYEWMDFLGKMTLETDNDWYIKTHPDYLPSTKIYIEAFIRKYPKFCLLPSDSSHHQLIEEGITCALTTYGTIGFEYAALGIPVVNASVNNPHIAYNFNLHPKSVEEYRDILKNLGHIDLHINKNEVYEYYFMTHIYNTSDWLFDDYKQMEEDMGGYREQFTPNVYEYWMREWTQEKHRDVCKTLERFIDSGEFRLNHSHMNSPECIDAK